MPRDNYGPDSPFVTWIAIELARAVAASADRPDAFVLAAYDRATEHAFAVVRLDSIVRDAEEVTP